MSKMLLVLACYLFLAAFNSYGESFIFGKDSSNGVVFESDKEVLVTGKEIRFSVKAINKDIKSFSSFINDMYSSLPTWYLEGAINSSDVNLCWFRINGERLEMYIADWYWYHHLESNKLAISEMKLMGIHENLRKNFMMFAICQRIKDGENHSMAEYVNRYDKILYAELGVDIIP